MGRAILTMIGAATLAIAGCGGEEKTAAPKPPTLPGQLAAALAVESDQIAESLAAGRECAAHRQAQALRAHVGDAVGSGDVPPELGQEMSAAATVLNEGINCEPAPKPAPQPAPTGCEQVVAQLTQLQAQWEQAAAQEDAAHGQDKKAAKDLQKQLEDQAEPLIEQFRDQCDGEEGDVPSFDGFPGSDGGGPPGLDGGSPGNSGHGGGDGD